MSEGPILVTGAAGFIGMHTAERLLARGETVVGIDNFNTYYDPALKEARAARLQRFDLAAPPKTIGTNTIACLQSGTIFGHVGLVEGLVRRIRDELGSEAIVIGTGGLVDVIGAHTKTIQTIDRDLTLKGLRLLHDLNRGPS